MSTYPSAILKSGKDRPILRGHPWIFSGAVKNIGQNAHPGDFLLIKNNSGRKLGIGYYNPKSQICIRVLTRNPEESIDGAFVRQRVLEAFQRRKVFFRADVTDSYRLIYSEADGLPGFVVDKYADFLVVQCHTLGAEMMKDLLIGALNEIIEPRGIIERSKIGVRRHEGLDDGNVGLLSGEDAPHELVMRENGLRYAVNLKDGQKTGFFLDQRDNRSVVKQLSEGMEVLNLYSYTGATAVSALAGDAESVLSVDTDKDALKMVERNLELNALSSKAHEALSSDVSEVLREFKRTRRKFDLVILDPPAFAKHRGALKSALRGYLEINSRAMSLLRSGGLLLTSSCSGLVKEEMFREMLINAARDASVRLVVLGEYPQPCDHPVLPAFPEGKYLKTSLVQVLDY